MGPAGDPIYGAFSPAVAYNSMDNQYMVVWCGVNNVIGEYGIWGQIVDASNEAQLGADIRISEMGPPDAPACAAHRPDVVYNSAENEYLVVWSGDDYGYDRAGGEFEILGQRLNASG